MAIALVLVVMMMVWADRPHLWQVSDAAVHHHVADAVRRASPSSSSSSASVRRQCTPAATADSAANCQQ